MTALTHSLAYGVDIVYEVWQCTATSLFQENVYGLIPNTLHIIAILGMQALALVLLLALLLVQVLFTGTGTTLGEVFVWGRFLCGW